MKKLLKNEFKATYRFFIGIYIVFIVMAILERISLFGVKNFQDDEGGINLLMEILNISVSGLTVIAIIIFALSPCVYCVIRFYKNMLGDQGYLSFTLPVTPNQHIWSKLIVACTWSIITFLVGIIVGSVFLFSYDKSVVMSVINFVKENVSNVYELTDGFIITPIVIFVFVLFIDLVAGYLTYYTAMSIGQTFNKNKIMMSILFFVVLSMVESLFAQLGQLLFTASVWRDFVYEMDVLVPSKKVPAELVIQLCQMISGGYLVVFVTTLITAITCFFITKYLLTKKLNLS